MRASELELKLELDPNPMSKPKTLPEPQPGTLTEPELEPEPDSEQLDPFKALGLGPDLYEYRGPYRQYLPTDNNVQCPKVLARQYAAAARAISGADFLLVGAGAGMGVDAGLAAYADVAAVPAWASRGHDYGSLCRPALLDEDPSLFYGEA